MGDGPPAHQIHFHGRRQRDGQQLDAIQRKLIGQFQQGQIGWIRMPDDEAQG